MRAFFAPFEEFELKEWRKIMAVNLDGMFLMAQAMPGRNARNIEVDGAELFRKARSCGKECVEIRFACEITVRRQIDIGTDALHRTQNVDPTFE